MYKQFGNTASKTKNMRNSLVDGFVFKCIKNVYHALVKQKHLYKSDISGNWCKIVPYLCKF